VYYKMSGEMGGEPNVYMKELNNESAMVQSGKLITDPVKARIFELPFRFEMEVQVNEDDGSREAPRLMAYYDATQLMHKRLVEVLQAAGVDNLQTYPAVLSEAGVVADAQEYVVTNVVGAVACASVDKSDAIPFADRLFFNDLVIDLAQTRGLLMFRLSESLLDVLVHETVAKELMKHAFPYLVLTPLDEV
jgi:hypothetical protein